jgi:hypothetical protein
MRIVFFLLSITVSHAANILKWEEIVAAVVRNRWTPTVWVVVSCGVLVSSTGTEC